MADEIRTVKNNFWTNPYDVTKNIVVQPTTTSEQTSVGAPDPAMMQYIQENIIKPTQKAYGINPDTGDVTPFQALGYNPEDERKRRAAEMALNDRKRKENAWYNAFAVVGDSLTAALGGNVWQRQPNRIGQQAIADNARLQAEQKAEDEGNAAKLRDAGAAYANTVNNLIKNYLTKTKTTRRTGGNKTETEHHDAQTGYRQQSFKIDDGNGSRTSGGGGRKIVPVAISVKDKDGNITKNNKFHISKEDADYYGNQIAARLARAFASAEEKDEENRTAIDKDMISLKRELEKAEAYNPNARDLLKRWDYGKLIAMDRIWDYQDLNDIFQDLWASSAEYDGKPIKITPVNNSNVWPGVEPEEYDD